MAKKTAKKKTAKKTAKKSASKKASASKKSVSKKTPAKKTAKKTAKKATTKTAKKTAKKVAKKVAKKTAKKSAAKKSSAKKSATKKTAAKKTTKKPSTKAASKKTSSKAATTKKSPEKKTAAKKTSSKATTKPAAAEKGDDTAKDDADASKAGNRKGITIVKPTKKTSSRSRNTPKFVMPERPMLLGPGSKMAGKPLIPSGPSAPKVTSVFDAPKSRRKKSPLTKAKLDNYRALLIAKRAELLGDVVSMENEALRSESGGSSHTPSHLAEQGSENYDQTLSLNLAAQDRRLIKDIDEALKRIEEGTFGLCELTGQPIPEARLNELPWARYTIEAARELERRGTSA